MHCMFGTPVTTKKLLMELEIFVFSFAELVGLTPLERPNPSLVAGRWRTLGTTPPRVGFRGDTSLDRATAPFLPVRGRLLEIELLRGTVRFVNK